MEWVKGDRSASPFKVERVIRLLISFLAALGLALAPVTANGAAVQASDMPGCAMDGKMPSKPSDRAKMDCCTPACQAAAPAALLPVNASADPVQPDPMSILIRPPVKELASLISSGLDPPPRA